MDAFTPDLEPRTLVAQHILPQAENRHKGPVISTQKRSHCKVQSQIIVNNIPLSTTDVTRPNVVS